MPCSLWDHGLQGRWGGDWAALQQGNGLGELSLMSELWEAPTGPGLTFLLPASVGEQKMEQSDRYFL